MSDKSKVTMMVLGVFAIVLVCIGGSFAFFTYTRSGSELVIKTGELEFAMIDGTSVTLENAFPQEDADGKNNDPYTFEVRNTSTDGTMLYYDVTLLTNNSDTTKTYFKNGEIKYLLSKNNVIMNTNTDGELLSTISGFDAESSTGEGVVLTNQAIESTTTGTTDTYNLRIWIDSQVDYSGDIDENGLMVGTHNNDTYSLKVRVDAIDSQQ